jgi:omega-6 fatty acid desaturase (delta-12 desaturase)
LLFITGRGILCFVILLAASVVQTDSGKIMNFESDSSAAPQNVEPAVWKELVREYQKPSVPRAAWQILNTLGPVIALWWALHWSLTVSYWLTFAFIVLLSGFTVRTFIIFHDCTHGSFFRSSRANDILGFITGVMTFTPYFHWRWEHSVHHATSGHLDKRGMGDIWTMTVQEYIEASRWKRFGYRLARNPFVLFGLAPVTLFMVLQRFPKPGASRRERYSVYWMNAALALKAICLALWFGVLPYVIIQVALLLVAGGAGVWMFYVQHQFEDVYWEHSEEWDYTAAALQGSSFYKLPRIFQWFTGNIGYHHIHHLSPRIPNYNLERCHKAHELFQKVKPITFFPSLKTMGYRLWDEKRKKLIGFGEFRRIYLRPQKISAN